MDEFLEKIDIIRERTGVSYKEAKEALESNNGDVVETIVFIEEKYGKSWMDSMSGAGNEIIEKLKAIIKKGNVSRIMLKKDDQVILNVPVTAGAVGVILAPIVSLLGVSAAIATKTTIEIVKTNGDIVDINEMAEETFTGFKDIVSKTKTKNNENDENIILNEDDITFNEEYSEETLNDLDDDLDY